jgi:hypothetical protein
MANCSQPLIDISEFLRVKHRDCEIDQQEDGEDKTDGADDVEVHGLPQLLACLDVEKRQGEEGYGEQQHHCVLHSRSPVFSASAPAIPALRHEIKKSDAQAHLPWTKATCVGLKSAESNRLN